MTIDLPTKLADALKRLADVQGRDVDEVVEEAVREYLESVAITDIEPSDVAATQLRLASELRQQAPWTERGESVDDETC